MINVLAALKESDNHQLKMKRIRANAILPIRGSEYSAGLDLYACYVEEDQPGVAINGITITVEPHKAVKVKLGWAMEIPEGYGGFIIPRSGLASKEFLRPINTPGLIDSDYRGEAMVILFNDNAEKLESFNIGDRIAQLVIIPYYYVTPVEVTDLSVTNRDIGGFGSTGR